MYKMLIKIIKFNVVNKTLHKSQFLLKKFNFDNIKKI